MSGKRNAQTDARWLDRPLSARSVIASFLLGMHPPRARAGVLVHWCALFGIAPGTARVALSRMVAQGELAARDGRYELAGGMRGRQRGQDFSRSPALRGWDGTWRLAVVTASDRSAAERAALRAAMRTLRFAPQADGVWIRPDNLPSAAGTPAALAVAAAQCRWWSARPEGDPVELADALFEPRVWNARARRLTRAVHDVRAALDRRPDAQLGPAFELAAAVLAHLRADPLLPELLLPARWAGGELRDAYERFQPEFSAAVAAWLRARDASGGAAP